MQVCTVRRDKNMPLAMSDVESPPATKAALLTSVSVSASLGSGLRLAGLRRGLRHRHVVTGDHETTLQAIVDVVNPPVKGA